MSPDRQVGAAALLELREKSIAVTVAGGHGNPVEVPLKTSWRSARANLNARLLRFRDHLDTGAVTVAAAYRGLETLFDKSVAVAHDIFVDFDDFTDILAENQLGRLATAPILIEIVGVDAEFFPLEFLPVFPLRWDSADRVTTRADLARVAQTFLGFGAVVRRTTLTTLSQTTVFDVDGVVPIRLFRDAHMEGAAYEERYLRDRQDVELRGPWPGPGVPQGSGSTLLSAFIFDPARARDLGEVGEDCVHHFACHFYVAAGQASESQLLVRAPDDDAHEIAIEAMQAQLFLLRSRHGRGCRALPLVFINACGSSTLPPDGAASLPHMFLLNGNPGFIGTETAIPDAFASAFSEVFYDLWLSGRPLGWALLAAKLVMLERECNPLGILYSMYGNPDLRVKYR